MFRLTVKQRVSKQSVDLAQQPLIPKMAPQVLKAPSPVREVAPGSTTKWVKLKLENDSRVL